MEIGQWITTFASHGVDNMNSGDMVWSYSPDMKNDIQRDQFPKIMGYPEITVPLKAKRPDIIRVYTKKLEQGYLYFSSTHFIGENHDGTPGRGNNYLSHCFRIKDPNFYPIELYQWDGIRKKLTKEEDNINYSIPLLEDYSEEWWKEIQKEQQEKEDSLLKKLYQFFCYDTEYSQRAEWLCYLIEAVLNMDEQNLIILYDKAENIPLWIAAVCLSLPVKCAQRISFNTFCPNPLQQNYDIRGVAAGFEQEDISSYKNSNQHYFFDMLNGDIPSHYMCNAKKEVPFPEHLMEMTFYKYVRQCWSYDIEDIADNPDYDYVLKKFHKFLDGLGNFTQVNNDIKNAAILYEMLETDKFFEFSIEELKQGLDFKNSCYNSSECIFLNKKNNIIDVLLKKQFADLQHQNISGSEKNLDIFNQFFNILLGEVRNSAGQPEKKAEQYLKLYYLLVINCIIGGKQNPEEFSLLREQMQLYNKEVTKKNLSIEIVPGCIRESKNQHLEKITFQQMPVLLAEYSEDPKITEELLYLFELQVTAPYRKEEEKNIEQIQSLIKSWIGVIEKSYANDSRSFQSMTMQLYEVLEKNSCQSFALDMIEEIGNHSTYSEEIQNQLILKYCEKRIHDNSTFERIGKEVKILLQRDLGKMAGTYLALSLEKQSLKEQSLRDQAPKKQFMKKQSLKNQLFEKQVNTFNAIFQNYFKDKEKHWDALNPAFDCIIQTSQNENNHVDVFMRSYELFIKIIEGTNREFHTYGFKELIHMIADKSIITDPDIRSCPVLSDEDNIECVYEYCRKWDLFNDEDMNQIRCLIYISQMDHVRRLEKWKNIWKWYEEFPVIIKLNDKEKKQYEKYMENLLKKKWFNYSGYRVLMDGAHYDDSSMQQTMKKVIAESFHSKLKNAAKSKRDLMDVLSFLNVVDRGDYKSILKIKEPKKLIKTGTKDKILDRINDLEHINTNQKDMCRKIFERFYESI